MHSSTRDLLSGTLQPDDYELRRMYIICMFLPAAAPSLFSRSNISIPTSNYNQQQFPTIEERWQKWAFGSLVLVPLGSMNNRFHRYSQSNKRLIRGPWNQQQVPAPSSRDLRLVIGDPSCFQHATYIILKRNEQHLVWKEVIRWWGTVFWVLSLSLPLD